MTETTGCNDIGNKDRFVQQTSGTSLFVVEHRQWIRWDGTRWAPDHGQVYVNAENVAKGIYQEAAESTDKEKRLGLGRWAERSQSRGSLENMLALASKHLGVSIEEFDTDPMKINCKNGLLNLRTMELSPHDPKQRVMKQTSVNYRADALCPQWLEFLHQVFQWDTDLIDWMQQAIGYSMTGLVDEHAFFLLHGNGRNGKGVLCETLLSILGSYGEPNEFEVFLASDKSNVRVAEATGRLKGCGSLWLPRLATIGGSQKH